MNTLKKMFLLTTIVLLLVGFTTVSADDIETNDVTNDAVYTDATAFTAVSDEQDMEENSLMSSSPEDIQPGSTSTIVEPVMAVADDYVNLTATVDRNIPGSRLSEGNVQFDVNDGDIVEKVPLYDGEATTTVFIPEEWVGQNITYTASFLGSQSFLPSSDESIITVVKEFYDTITTIDPVIGEFNKPITITATVKASVEGEVNGGSVFFTTETGNITDEDGYPILVDVENSIAKLETIASPSWKTDGDVNTIWATFTGYEEFMPSESESTALRLYDKIYNTTTTMISPKGQYDEPINLTANIVTEDSKPVDVGDVYFVIGAKVLTDDEGHVLYAYPNNGVATLETIASRDWHDGGDLFTIHAVFEGVGEYLGSESEDVALTITEPVNPPVKPVKPVINKKTTKTLKDTSSVKTYKVIVNDNVVATGNVITLGTLNDIFNKDFTNGILVVYLDGKVVFNGTTANDLSLVILEIIESLIGEHELKVEFTNSNNETNTYVENVTIQ